MAVDLADWVTDVDGDPIEVVSFEVVSANGGVITEDLVYTPPEQRGRGYATEILRLALVECRRLGIGRALVTCDIDNPASRRVIEKNGGEFDGIIDDPEIEIPKRRYWVDTGLG